MMSSPATTLLPLSQSAPASVVNAIARASASTGVDFDYLLQQAATESSFDTSAQAGTSSARGLYQFIDSTWLDLIDKHGSKHGLGMQADTITRDANGQPRVSDPGQLQSILALRDNPAVSALMAAEFTLDNKQCLEGSLGRKVGNTELYMAHFLGAGGATRFLSELDANPDCDAASVLPAAARANQSVFFARGQSRSVDEIYSHFADKFSAPATPQVRQSHQLADPATAATVDPSIASFVTPAIAPAIITARQEFAAPRTEYSVLAAMAAGSSTLARTALVPTDRLTGMPAWQQQLASEQAGALNSAFRDAFSGLVTTGTSTALQTQPLTGLPSLQRADLNLMSLRLLQTLPERDSLSLDPLLQQA